MKEGTAIIAQANANFDLCHVRPAHTSLRLLRVDYPPSEGKSINLITLLSLKWRVTYIGK